MMMFYKEKGIWGFRNTSALNIQDKTLLEIADKAKELWYWEKDINKVKENLSKEYRDVLENYEVVFYPEMIIIKDRNPLDSYECEAVKIVNVDFSSIIWKIKVAIDKIRYETKKENYKIEIDTNHAWIMALLDWLQNELENISDWTPGVDKLEIQINEKENEIKIDVDDFNMDIKPY
jgi:hypothetical protein